MPTQIIMDRTGDTRHQFDTAKPAEVTDAEKRFNEMIGKGHVAIDMKDNGTGKVIRKFDPAVETTVFRPPLIGG